MGRRRDYAKRYFFVFVFLIKRCYAVYFITLNEKLYALFDEEINWGSFR